MGTLIAAKQKPIFCSMELEYRFKEVSGIEQLVYIQWPGHTLQFEQDCVAEIYPDNYTQVTTDPETTKCDGLYYWPMVVRYLMLVGELEPLDYCVLTNLPM